MCDSVEFQANEKTGGERELVGISRPASDDPRWTLGEAGFRVTVDDLDSSIVTVPESCIRVDVHFPGS